MAQQLIVEGADAHFIASVSMKRNLPAPRGYANKEKFIKEFVVSAGSYDKALVAFREALNRTELTRIGLIVDADEAGGASRWQAIRQILTEELPNFDFSNYALSADGIVISISATLTVGIWIMPDNNGNGYLEHLVAKLAPQQDAIWQQAVATVNSLRQRTDCKFTEIRKQKALVYTWLAWQKEPGKPIGLGVQANYFNANATEADAFVGWIQNVFILGEPTN